MKGERELEKRLKAQIWERKDATAWDADVFLFWIYRHLLRSENPRWSANQIEARALRALIEQLGRIRLP